MPSRSRSVHNAKTDILIGAMSVVLYILLGLSFFHCLSVNNIFLRYVNRTLATTLLTFAAMSIAMHAVYGGFDVGRKKNKPVISAMISGIAVTDVTDCNDPASTGLPKANVLIYRLEDGSTVIVRPSGTEPKIKTYFTTKGNDLAEAQAKKDLLADACKPILS